MTLHDEDRYWRSTYARTLLGAILAIVGILGVQGLLDRLEQDTEARLAFLRAADDKCLPLKPGESAVIVTDGQHMRCRVYTNVGHGLAPRLVSSAVAVVPPQ